jgi:hypothetical protein
MHALPARETIRRLGTINHVAEALDLSTSTVWGWMQTKKNKADAIPRWRYFQIKALADAQGVTLPRPLPAKKRKGA